MKLTKEFLMKLITEELNELSLKKGGGGGLSGPTAAAPAGPGGGFAGKTAAPGEISPDMPTAAAGGGFSGPTAAGPPELGAADIEKLQGHSQLLQQIVALIRKAT